MCSSSDKKQTMRWVGQVTHTGTAKVYIECSWEDLRERDGMEDLGRNGRILQYMIKKENDEGAGTIHRIDQAQDRNKWQSVVKMVMNHRIP